MAFKIKPLGNRVVVTPNAVEEKTQGGIYIPTKSDEKVLEGTVVAVGKGKEANGSLQAMQVKEKDTVVFNQYAATEVEHSGEKYFVLKEDDLLAIIE